MNLKGIDISEFNGNIDFKKIKKQVDFVYIRATYGRFGIDKKFLEYTKGCIDNNIPFSFYYYSYATTKELAEEEVEFFLNTINEYLEKTSFPLMIDMEDSDSYKLQHGNPSKEVLSEICKIACDKIADKKYSPIIYASADWFKNRLDEEKIKGYLKWVAWWEADEDKIEKDKFQIWQYSSKGKIEGIESKFVDLDYSFIDFISLKQYVKNISMINFIKMKTLLNDLDIQYLSCYKWGQDLITKLFDGLHKEKLKRENLNISQIAKSLQKYFNLESKTLNFISLYIHSEEVLQKLYNSITLENNVVKIVDDEE